MKPGVIIILLISINCFCANAQHKPGKNILESKIQAGHQKENALAMLIFKALKEQDSKQWITLYPTNDEYKNILQQMLAAKMEGLTQQGIDEMLAHRRIEFSAAYRTEFANFTRLADSMGINWKYAVFEKFDYDLVAAEKAKLKYLNGDIWFRCRNKHFVIEGIEAIELNAGYRLQAVKDIRQVDDGD